MFDNNSLSLHELSDVENTFQSQTICYTSDHKYNDSELIGLLEDAANADRPEYAHVRCSYAEFPLIDTDAISLAF